MTDVKLCTKYGTSGCQNPVWSKLAKFCLECKEKKEKESEQKYNAKHNAKRNERRQAEKDKREDRKCLGCEFIISRQELPTKKYCSDCAHRVKKEQCKVYLQKKREDPAFRLKELAYQIGYCSKRGISLEELKVEIEGEKGGAKERSNLN